MTVTTVTLRNGSVVAEQSAQAILMNLRNLQQEDWLAFFELVEKARKPSHNIYSDCVQTLISRSFVDKNGNMHNDVRNVIVSAVEGEDFDVHIVNPFVSK